MVLDRHRWAADWIVVPLSRAFRNVNPNTITWLSFPFAVLAGILYHLSGPTGGTETHLLIAALAAVGMSSVLDLLDGKIAKTFGKQSAKGDYLDHVIDRFADVAIFTGIAFSAWSNVTVGFFALLGVLLTSYMGTQAQAVGIGRNYGGILGRADRLGLVSVATAVDWIRLMAGWDVPDAWIVRSALDAVLWWFAIAGILTALQRFWQGLRWFDENPGT